MLLDILLDVCVSLHRLVYSPLITRNLVPGEDLAVLVIYVGVAVLCLQVFLNTDRVWFAKVLEYMEHRFRKSSFLSIGEALDYFVSIIHRLYGL